MPYFTEANGVVYENEFEDNEDVCEHGVGFDEVCEDCEEESEQDLLDTRGDYKGDLA